MKGSRGFTLVELMIAASIIGILTAIAVPSVTEMLQRQRVTNDVQRVVAGLQEIRNFARTRLRCVEVAVSANEIVATPYATSTAATGNPCAGVTSVADSALTGQTIRIPVEHVTLNAISGAGLVGNLWFDRRAATFNQTTGRELLGPAELTITAPNGGSYKVRIFPKTGTVRLVK